jgi:hypothetical protein
MNDSCLRSSRPQSLGSVLLVFGLAFSLSGCASAQQAGSTRWQEEALQHDASKIIVERTVQRGGRHEPHQQPPIGQQSLAFTVPGTGQKLVWEDNFSQDLGGASFNVRLVGVVAAQAYVLGTPAGCLSYNKWGRPNPPYVAFRYEAGSWRRIAVEELPSVIERPNLIASDPDNRARKVAETTGKNLITAEMVSEHIGGYRQPEFRRILREPIRQAGGEACGEMVGNGKGRWVGLGWFKKQPSYDACLAYCVQEEIGSDFCPCIGLFKAK